MPRRGLIRLPNYIPSREVSYVPTLGKGGALNALSPVKAALQANEADINWIAVGDSTGADTDEFIYLSFDWLKGRYPAYSFVYYPPDGAGAYGAPVTISTGSGPHTFRLYNNSVSGQVPDYLMGSKFDAAFVTPARNWDVVWWNHGKNLASTGNQIIAQGELMAALAQVQLAFPSAGHLVTDQYPNRDDSGMAILHAAWIDIVNSDASISLLDFYTPSFEASDYTDNEHFTAAANTAKLLPLFQALWNGTRAGVWAASTPWLDTLVANMLDGSSGEDFANFALDGTSGSVPGAADAVPFGWSSSGTIAFSKEGVITYDGAARSQKMQGSGSGQTAISRGQVAANIDAMKGQYAVLTVVEYVDAGANSTVGRFGVNRNGTGGGSVTSRATNTGQGGWRVRCLGPFLCPSDMTSCTVTLYHDTATTPDSDDPVYYQWACLSIGKLPRAPS